jgi:hypothetical protein
MRLSYFYNNITTEAGPRKDEANTTVSHLHALVVRVRLLFAGTLHVHRGRSEKG